MRNNLLFKIVFALTLITSVIGFGLVWFTSYKLEGLAVMLLMSNSYLARISKDIEEDI